MPSILNFNTAILFLIFNRLDTTKQVFEQIRIAKPPRLYVASDGARSNKLGENDIVDSVRNHVLQNIDWECEVKTLFRETNLGCKYAVSGAISWFFEHEEQGIILEDDCLPSTSFFSYCATMLEYYKDDDKVMMVSGNNFIDSKRIKHDYYFLTIPHIWGWATWRRTWNLYDVEFFKKNKLEQINFPKFINSGEKYLKFWQEIFNVAHSVNTWDYQFSFTVFKHNGLCINPRYNLISNIGFDSNATHTTDENNNFSNIKRYESRFTCNDQIDYVTELDRLDSQICGFYRLNFWQKVINKLSKIFGLR